MALVALVSAAVAVPATIVFAGNGGSIGGDANEQFVAWSEKQEAPKNWQVVPHVGDLPWSTGPVSVTMSAQMTRGKAKFRIVRATGSPAVAPGPVRFNAGAANAFTWGFNYPCVQDGLHEVQWKRVGTADAVAAKLSMHMIRKGFCF